MSSRKVIHVVQHLAPGGLETLVLDSVRFADPNDKCLVVSLEGTKRDALRKWKKLEPFADKLSFLNKPSGAQMGLIVTLHKVFKMIEPDVVHTHHIGPLLYAGFAAKLAGVKQCVHTEHDAWHLEDPKHHQLQKLALSVVRPHLVADAECVKNNLNRHFPSQAVTTIVNGIDTEYFTPASQSLSRQLFNLPGYVKLLGSAGRLEHVKGHDRLIKAMSLLPSNHHLALAGDGSQKHALETLVAKLGLDNRVHFLGRVDNIARFYQSLDVFCLPSRFEGYPLSSIEAQACNIPTAVTNVGSSGETLCPSSGKLIKANSIVDMAATLLHLANHKPDVAPRDFVRKDNDIRTMVQRYEALTVEPRQPEMKEAL